MLLNITCLLIILFAGSAVFLRSAIHNVLSLVLAFFASAGLMIQGGLEILGFVLIIVYVGAVAVLFVFMLMMFPKESFVRKRYDLLYTLIAAITCAIIAYIISHNTVPSFKIVTDFTISELAIALYQKYHVGVLLMGGLLFVSMVVIVGLTLPRNYAQREKVAESKKKEAALPRRVRIIPYGGIDD